VRASSIQRGSIQNVAQLEGKLPLKIGHQREVGARVEGDERRLLLDQQAVDPRADGAQRACHQDHGRGAYHSRPALCCAHGS
jgi:hypothetical protein